MFVGHDHRNSGQSARAPQPRRWTRTCDRGAPVLPHPEHADQRTPSCNVELPAPRQRQHADSLRLEISHEGELGGGRLAGAELSSRIRCNESDRGRVGGPTRGPSSRRPRPLTARSSINETTWTRSSSCNPVDTAERIANTRTRAHLPDQRDRPTRKLRRPDTAGHPRGGGQHAAPARRAAHRAQRSWPAPNPVISCQLSDLTGYGASWPSL